MVVGPTLLPVFEQLGIYDELLAIGKYLPQTLTYKESLQPMPPLDLTPVEELYVPFLTTSNSSFHS